ncbi:MAG: MOSC domain-containing protein [Ignavibacteria bacterium]|nr:MOSC domain-containing protein [Ignavibacteria bacterium]
MSVRLTGISIYPIKAAGGIPLQHARVEERGLELDRRCMIVDSANVFMTQRVYPRLALISVKARDPFLHVTAPGTDDLRLAVPEPAALSVRVRVWDDLVDALSFPREADYWFSSFLEIPCRPVYMPDTTRRIADTEHAHGQHTVSFADGYPFLLISEESLGLLNTKLPEPLPMNRFRPNLVVAGCEPHAEDSWHHIRIGGVEFLLVRPCARCVVTTVDQETGVKGREPLRTLGTYRQQNGKILFGQNMITKTTGVVRVGDPVAVLQ